MATITNGYLNECQLLGYLGSDPKIGTSKAGQDHAYFSLATTCAFTNKEGEKTERTTWHRIVVFGGLVKAVEKLSKGRRVLVKGEINTRSYEKEGIKRSITDITASTILFLDTPQKTEQVDNDTFFADLEAQKAQEDTQQPTVDHDQN